MIASLNIVAKMFAKTAKTFAGLMATIIATRRRPGLQKVNSGQESTVNLVKVNG